MFPLPSKISPNPVSPSPSLVGENTGKKEGLHYKEWNGKDFNFPFETPYSIQVELMRSLYGTLENGKSGLFESPTGTGKSLSVICSTLTWLKNNPHHESSVQERESYLRGMKQHVGQWAASKSRKLLSNRHIPSVSIKKEGISTGISWLEESYRKRQLKLAQEEQLRHEESLDKKKRKFDRINAIEKDPLFQLGQKRYARNPAFPSRPSKYSKSSDLDTIENLGNAKEMVDQFLLEESQTPCGISAMEELEDSSEGSEDSLPLPVRKIFYASRTHTQLNQFIGELKKTPFGAFTKVVPLGSRRTHCINGEVQKSKSITQMNDKCITLKKSSKKNDKELSACLHLKTNKQQHSLRDNTLAIVGDIEDMVRKGRRLGACPYYSSREAIPSAELVTLPYNMLLHKNMRDSLGISLRDNIVVIDEAHNLIESINGMYSVCLSFLQIQQAHDQLARYHEKYANRLSADNRENVELLLSILDKLMRYLSSNTKEFILSKNSSDDKKQIHSLNDFIFSCTIDDINLFHFEQFFERTELTKKLQGFVDFQHMKDSQDGMHTSLSPMNVVRSFLQALTNTDSDGRILTSISKMCSKSEIQFILLNPEKHFASVLQEARSVLLLGGTLKPFDEFKELLFEGKSDEEIDIFSCSHVMPKENLLTLSIPSGPSNVPFCFNFQSRSDPKLISELGSCVANICMLVPDGAVLFFPSYQYLDLVIREWKSGPLFGRINSKKQIFYCESKESNATALFESYKEYIASKTGNGALLCSVVGGKMSEGINFSDELGRCVIMVGLPFPNRTDPLLVEKLKFLHKASNSDSRHNEYYENMCMKAVNQSIGRSIRHQNDYSTILLLDSRYQSPNISGKLPQWIKETLQPVDRFGSAYKSIREFFRKFQPKKALPISAPLHRPLLLKRK